MLMAVITLAAQNYAIKHDLHWQTIVFNILCLSQLAHVLAIRSESASLFNIGIFSNKPLILSVILTLILQAAVTYIPFFQPVFKTEALTMWEFLTVGVLALLVFIAVEIEKSIQRKKQ